LIALKYLARFILKLVGKLDEFKDKLKICEKGVYEEENIKN